MTEPKPNIFQRLNAAQQEVTFVQKTKPTGMRYPVVSHDVVTAKCRPALVKHGILYLLHDLVVTQNGNRTEARFNVRFQNVDECDDFVIVPTVGYGIDDQDKGPGKAISYGVKIALLKTLALESGEGEDPDFDQETPHVPADLSAYMKMMKENIAAVTTSSDLRPIDEGIINAYRTHNIDEATASALRGLIRQRVDELKRA